MLARDSFSMVPWQPFGVEVNGGGPTGGDWFAELLANCVCYDDCTRCAPNQMHILIDDRELVLQLDAEYHNTHRDRRPHPSFDIIIRFPMHLHFATILTRPVFSISWHYLRVTSHDPPGFHHTCGLCKRVCIARTHAHAHAHEHTHARTHTHTHTRAHTHVCARAKPRTYQK
eukprot:99807-Amphidinium_carterae.1